MVLSTRGILAIGLGLAGASASLWARSLAQQDGSLRKTAGPGTGAGAARRLRPPFRPSIGTVDLDAVFKGYEKFKATNKDFQAAVLARQNELMKIKSEAEEEGSDSLEAHARHRRLQETRKQGDRAQGTLRRRTRASPARVSGPRVRKRRHHLQGSQFDGDGHRPVAQDQLRHPGQQHSALWERPQLRHGGIAKHDGLLRPRATTSRTT